MFATTAASSRRRRCVRATPGLAPVVSTCSRTLLSAATALAVLRLGMSVPAPPAITGDSSEKLVIRGVEVDSDDFKWKPFLLPSLNISQLRSPTTTPRPRPRPSTECTSGSRESEDVDVPPPAERIVDTRIAAFDINSLIQRFVKNAASPGEVRRRTERGDNTDSFKSSSLPSTRYKLSLDSVNTYHDVFRRFYQPALTDKQIEYKLYGRYRQDATSADAARQNALNAVSRHVHRVQEHVRDMPLAHPIPELVNIASLWGGTGGADPLPVSPDEAEYIPPHTILHRCPRDSTCCPLSVTDGRCRAAGSRNISLPFLVAHKIHADDQVMLDPAAPELVVWVPFVNHTSCQCVPGTEVEKAAPPSATPCTCPSPLHEVTSEFSSRFDFSDYDITDYRSPGEDGDCRCDCYRGDDDCIRIKLGIDSLPPRSQRCVESGKCKEPTCEYGAYNHIDQICPDDTSLEHYEYAGLL